MASAHPPHGRESPARASGALDAADLRQRRYGRARCELSPESSVTTHLSERLWNELCCLPGSRWDGDHGDRHRRGEQARSFQLTHFIRRSLKQHVRLLGTHAAAAIPQHTQFFFDVAAGNLEKCLDIFSRFFIDPLFSESSASREINSVHSEFSRTLQDDNYRKWQVR